MKIMYLGTGAAEGIPGTFCKCHVCMEAIKLGGPDLRSRSQALIDDKILIDLPPDTYAHYLIHKFDLPSIKHVLITHSHMDHFFPTELALRCEGFVHPPIDTLHLYGNETVEHAFYDCLKEESRARKYINFHRLVPFTPIDLDDYRVFPFKAKHDPKEECLFYGIEFQGQRLLYATDTGFFPDATWDYLKETKLYFDQVTVDCTTMQYREGSNHMGIPDAIDLHRELMSIGAISEKTIYVLHHFSHNGGYNHTELCKEAAKHNFQISHDGLTLTF